MTFEKDIFITYPGVFSLRSIEGEVRNPVIESFAGRPFVVYVALCTAHSRACSGRVAGRYPLWHHNESTSGVRAPVVKLHGALVAAVLSAFVPG